MNPSTTEQMQILETIKAMRSQEENHYRYHVTDYLSELQSNIPTTSLDTDTAPVDASYRYIMGKRCNDIADLCNYKRETVAIAMNCLDRFMATQPSYEQQEIRLDRNLYQLAAMTALYISVEIHEQECMDLEFLVFKLLSHGVHTTAETIEAMEFEMLNAIEWRVNPPTAMSFTRLIINNFDLVVSENHNYLLLSPCEKEQIIDLTRIQIELTVNEYDFSTFNGSSIAYACMLNAFESYLGSDDDDDDGMFLAHIETTIGKILLVDEEECIHNLQDAIYELMNDCDDNDNDNSSSICQELLNKNSSTTRIMTNKDGFSCADDVITTGGNKNESFHLSPCTVVTSFCELEYNPYIHL